MIGLHDGLNKISEVLISIDVSKLACIRRYRRGMKRVARTVISKRKPVENIHMCDSGRTLNANVER